MIVDVDIEKLIEVCGLEPNQFGRYKKDSAESFCAILGRIMNSIEDKEDVFFYKDFKREAAQIGIDINWDWKTQLKYCVGFYYSKEIRGSLPVFDILDVPSLSEDGTLFKEIY